MIELGKSVEAELHALRDQARARGLASADGRARSDCWHYGFTTVEVVVSRENHRGKLVPEARWLMNGKRIGYNALRAAMRKAGIL